MAEQTIKMSLAGMRELELLILPSPIGVFKMQQLTLTDKGIPVEYILSHLIEVTVINSTPYCKPICHGDDILVRVCSSVSEGACPGEEVHRLNI